MIVLQFKCTLESDVIINQGSATEGSQKTLDFIPGNNFLGIVAGQLYEALDKEAFLVFHSGKIRFGDAHPSLGDLRSLRVPASWFIPKIKNQENKSLLLVHHHIHDFEAYKKEQPKQCRTGFYLFENRKAIEIPVLKSFAIKSAYDKNKRRSMDEQMYGYESLDRGTEFIFEIAADEDICNTTAESAVLLDKIEKSITGVGKRIGRSRTAQYGLVSIAPLEGEHAEWKTVTGKSSPAGTVYIYADSRLIFMDKYGLPTFTPNASDFNLDGTINWEKSQIRTFQYAPWNFKRQARDADRCGIEKGSMIVIDNVSVASEAFNYVGYYQNEGFGKVIYNPDFLRVREPEESEILESVNGQALYELCETPTIISEEKTVEQVKRKIENLKLESATQNKAAVLFNFLGVQKEQEMKFGLLYELTLRFAEGRNAPFTRSAQQKFASQWGTIRSIATQTKNPEKLLMDVLGAKITCIDGRCKVEIKEKEVGYVTHGIASEKWKDDQLNVLKDFFRELYEKQISEYASFALINLAAEMQKKCGG